MSKVADSTWNKSNNAYDFKLVAIQFKMRISWRITPLPESLAGALMCVVYTA